MNEQQQHRGIMIDLETMGTGPRAAMVSVGAVRFSRDGVEADGFYRRVDLASAMAAGLVVDASTIRWWLRQSEAAREEVARLPGGDLDEVLYGLEQWIREDDEPGIWGNGAASDPVWLASAFGACGFEVPWKHWQVRCFRTLKNLLPWVPAGPRTGPGHHALHDAIHQAEHAVRLLRELERLRPPAVEWVWQDAGDAPCGECGDTGTADDGEGRPVACGCWLGRARANAVEAIMRTPIIFPGVANSAAPGAVAGGQSVNNSPAAADADQPAEAGCSINEESPAPCVEAPGNTLVHAVSSLPSSFWPKRLRADEAILSGRRAEED